MTPQQRTAYACPCFEAEECNDVRYFRARSGFTVGVTCSVGLE